MSVDPCDFSRKNKIIFSVIKLPCEVINEQLMAELTINHHNDD